MNQFLRTALVVLAAAVAEDADRMAATILDDYKGSDLDHAGEVDVLSNGATVIAIYEDGRFEVADAFQRTYHCDRDIQVVCLEEYWRERPALLLDGGFRDPKASVDPIDPMKVADWLYSMYLASRNETAAPAAAA